MNIESKYILSFTAASLRLNEMVKVAKAAQEDDTTDLSTVKESGVVFGSVKNRQQTENSVKSENGWRN